MQDSGVGLDLDQLLVLAEEDLSRNLQYHELQSKPVIGR